MINMIINLTYLCMIIYLVGFMKPLVQLVFKNCAIILKLKAFKILINILKFFISIKLAVGRRDFLGQLQIFSIPQRATLFLRYQIQIYVLDSVCLVASITVFLKLDIMLGLLVLIILFVLFLLQL